MGTGCGVSGESGALWGEGEDQTSDGGDGSEDSDSGSDDDSDSDSDHDSDSDSDGDSDPSSDGDDTNDCEDVIDLPLRRITNSEYQASVLELLGMDAQEAAQFPVDETTAGFASNTISALGPEHLKAYDSAARAIATRALEADPDRLRTCDGVGADDQDDCVTAQLTKLVIRAYRRAPEDDELGPLLAFHQAAAAEHGERDADRMFLESVLLSPQFLYVTPPYDGAEQTSFASRLSFFLTGRPPDERLRELAEDGDLNDSDTLEAEVDRLLETDISEGALPGLFRQWLALERVEEAAKTAEVFPSWSDDLRQDMLEETSRFIAAAVSDGGLQRLLTSRETVVSAELAALYGVSDQHSGTGWEAVSLPEGERTGLLTQASFLAGHAHAVDTSWVFRGGFVRGHLLCDELPPPPADVDQSVANDDGRLEDPVCSGCHILMDPIGKAFDRYDAIGQYREQSGAGLPIPSDGEVVEAGESLDIAGKFGSPVELAERLGESETVQRCMTRQFYRFAQRRREVEVERCQIADMAELFSESDGDFRALMRAVALSPSFVAFERSH